MKKTVFKKVICDENGHAYEEVMTNFIGKKITGSYLDDDNSSLVIQFDNCEVRIDAECGQNQGFLTIITPN